jgi:probable HAF family extracellular repeat protein
MRDRFTFSQSVTQATGIPRTAERAGIVVSARSLALVLAFCALAMLVATPGWSQTAPVIEGPHRLPHASPNARRAEPEVDAVRAEKPAALHYKFITIGPESSPYAVAGGINNDGLVVGYYEDTNSVFHGFVWEDGEFKTVDYPGAAFTILGGVNNHGVVFGYYNDGTADHVVTYDARNGAWGKLPDIPGYPLNQGYGINDAGFAVGVAFSSTGAVAWQWDPVRRAYSYLSVPGAAEYSTSPSGLNNLNQVAGYYADSDGNYHGFIELNGNYTIYNAPGATETYPDGINDWGVLQGQWDDANYNELGFLATTTGYFQSVDYPGSVATAIVGINDKLAICGGYSPSPDFTPTMAFVAVLE